MRNPFTKEEQGIMNLLVAAHNKFLQLERMHPAELSEWISSFHNLQHIVSMRILQRDYPKHFLTKKPEFNVIKAVINQMKEV